MDLLIIDDHSKALDVFKDLDAFKFRKFKRILFNYYSKFAKTFSKHSNKFDLEQFLVLLYDCVPNI